MTVSELRNELIRLGRHALVVDAEDGKSFVVFSLRLEAHQYSAEEDDETNDYELWLRRAEMTRYLAENSDLVEDTLEEMKASLR